MNRIRIIKPVETPPPNTPLQWFYPDGYTLICNAVCAPGIAIAWCLPAKLDGTPSGPVHSLEAQGLPEPDKRIELRVRGLWYPGRRTVVCGATAWLVAYPNTAGNETFRHVDPDAWRPLPDDEPGDAELLEAARQVINKRGATSVSAALDTLAATVRKRDGGGK